MSLMQKKWFVVLLAAVIGMVILLLLFKLKDEPEPDEIPPPKLPEVEIVSIEKTTVPITVVTQGTVKPKFSVDIVAEVSGKVLATSPKFANGGFFEKGEVLITIDPQDYQFALVHAEAEVARAEELVALEQGRARQAKREWRDLGDPAANKLFLREPQLAAAKAGLASAIANRDKAKLNLERTQIKAPFSSRVSDIQVNLGQFVTPGARVAQVFGTETFEVRLSLTDKQASLIDLPQVIVPAMLPKVELHANVGGKDYQWLGKIVRTEATIDVKSRMRYAIAEVQQPMEYDMPLAVGQFVEAHIRGREIENAMEMPREVLFQGDKVLLLDDDNSVIFYPIELLHAQGESIVVAGLPDSGRVISSRVSYPAEGMKVTTIDDETSPEIDADQDGNTEITSAETDVEEATGESQ